MPQQFDSEKQFISSIFSDETGLFRTPAEPDVGDTVTVRLRLQKDADAQVTLLTGFPTKVIHMQRYKTDAIFDWYETKLTCKDPTTIHYAFLIAWKGKYIHYLRTGASLTDSVPFPNPAYSFRITPGFHVPEWAKGAVQYQIFTDRFRNGSHKNDVQEGEYHYVKEHAHRIANWYDPPKIGDFRNFYGGDLQGVLEKLDYLQDLGVEVIYFNPIFVSPSSHKYDTQDYDHIDPHFTVIPKDMDAPPHNHSRKNATALQYILRTTDPENLDASNAYFAEFCREVHRRGMKIILDGVFNHCGSFSHWMDREELYKHARASFPGAYSSVRSPYRNFFRFTDAHNYEAWWGVETLPKLNYEGSSDLCEEIFRVAQKWVSPPYSVDGWRLDVAADLGHSPEFNHLFWKEFRRRVKAANPNAVILAEHYGNPAEWLRGDEWDTVMNYDAFMEPLTFFLTGVEKHSDFRRDELHQDGPAFFHWMQETMSRLPTPSLQCAMNELSNHDHSRFLTRTNGRVGRLQSAGSVAASDGVQVPVFQEAVVVQMTWPGAPTIYYGDEAGQVGWTDPDNRRTYPWEHEDHKLIALHKALTALRREMPVLKNGSIQQVGAGHGWISYARFDEASIAVVACNNLDTAQVITLPLRNVGIPDGTAIMHVFSTGTRGYQKATALVGHVADGQLQFSLPPQSAIILAPKEPDAAPGTQDGQAVTD